MQKLRSSYHTDLKLAFQLDLVPVTLAQRVPRSTRYRFRTTDYSTLVGTDFSHFLENLELTKSIMASRSTRALAAAFLRIISLLRFLNLPLKSLPRITNMTHRSQIVTRILSASRFVPLPKLLAVLKLSPRRFASWKRKALPCLSSPRGRCRRSFPAQLTKGEALIIKRAFSCPESAHWPSISVAWKLIMDNRISASVSTILTYARAMGLTSIRKPLHQSRKKGSIVSSRPNEAWHIDVTVLRTRDGIRSYIQLILDSFSKRILSFSVARSISGHATAALLRSAMEALPCTPESSIMLISDGGSENINIPVKDYLSSVSIKLHIAQVDVSFSNSMIEAVNKILKYRYIFKKDIPSFHSVEPMVRESIADYNARPHYALHGLSPDETYAGKTFDFDGYKERLAHARARRLSENRSTKHPCEPFGEETATEIV